MFNDFLSGYIGPPNCVIIECEVVKVFRRHSPISFEHDISYGAYSMTLT
jgi:hypothetical protein